MANSTRHSLELFNPHLAHSVGLVVKCRVSAHTKPSLPEDLRRAVRVLRTHDPAIFGLLGAQLLNSFKFAMWLGGQPVQCRAR